MACPFTDEERASAWEKCAAIVKNHSDEMVKQWEDEINLLLTTVRARLVLGRPYRPLHGLLC